MSLHDSAAQSTRAPCGILRATGKDSSCRGIVGKEGAEGEPCSSGSKTEPFTWPAGVRSENGTGSRGSSSLLLRICRWALGFRGAGHHPRDRVVTCVIPHPLGFLLAGIHGGASAQQLPPTLHPV